MLFDLLRKGWYFDKDEPGSGGGKPDDSTEEKPDDKKSDDSEAGDDKKKKAKEEKVYSKAEVEEIVKERFERERRRLAKDAEEKLKTAEEETLAKNQEWQKLAETRATEIADLTKEKADLEPFREQAEKYKKALDDQLAKLKEKLPKYILPLIEKMDPVDAMTYITENAEALGAKPETYSETPDGKEKKVSDDDKKKSQEASTSVITRSF